MGYLHLRRMLRPIFFAAILSVVFNHSMAQGNTSGKRIPLQEALRQINHVFGTNFVYDQEMLKGKTTTYDMQTIRNKTLEEVLKGVLYPDGLVFLYVKRNYYTIVPKERIREQWNPGAVAPDSSLNMTKAA